MARQRLYMVHGRGHDAVGLVGSITAPLGRAGGNIVDLRQDVLHGLFTINLVVDLTHTELRLDDLQAMVDVIGEDTGLELAAEKYLPVPRSPDRRNLLLILVGRDRPGIISAAAELLGRYRANIELAQTIGREGLFLMELVTDVSQCRIPLENLMSTVEERMRELEIQALFQTDDVFNKRKRVLLFDVAGSFIEPEFRTEILAQTALDPARVAGIREGGDVAVRLRGALAQLEGFPASVLATLVDGMRPTSGTVELLQTLKMMGYKVALASTALSVLTDALRKRLALDHAFGVRTRVDDDSQNLLGEVTDEDLLESRPASVVPRLAALESMAAEDVTVLDDTGLPVAAGLRLEPDLGQFLHLYNERVLTDENLLGLLGCFGVPNA